MWRRFAKTKETNRNNKPELLNTTKKMRSNCLRLLTIQPAVTKEYG